MEPYIMLHCPLNFCTMGSVLSVLLIASCFSFLSWELLHENIRFQRVVDFCSFEALYPSYQPKILQHLASCIFLKKKCYWCLDHQWISVLQFSQLKCCLQSIIFNVLVIIWPMIIDFPVLDFCHSVKKKGLLFNWVNVLFFMTFFYRCNFPRKDHNWK